MCQAFGPLHTGAVSGEGQEPSRQGDGVAFMIQTGFHFSLKYKFCVVRMLRAARLSFFTEAQVLCGANAEGCLGIKTS